MGRRAGVSQGQPAVVVSAVDVWKFVEALLGEPVRSCEQLGGGLEADVFASETTGGRYAVKVSPAGSRPATAPFATR